MIKKSNNQQHSKAKNNILSEKEILEIADIFKLLGDPNRLKMIVSLIDNELCVQDLANVVSSSLSSISHQLRLLKSARLVKYRKSGKMVYYSIDDHHISSVVNQLYEHVNE